jgi:putative oxidoreductase
MKVGKLLGRLVIGGLFVGHGMQKLFGWFEGPGLEKTTGMMDSLELRPGRRNALAASVTETAGGAMLAAGALTPLAAASLIGTMFTAIRVVHFKNGLWNANKGYEFNLALIAALVALVDGGPGALSIDRALGIDDTGGSWALAALGAGAVGSTLAIELGHRHQEPIEGAQPQAPVPGATEPVPVAA